MTFTCSAGDAARSVQLPVSMLAHKQSSCKNHQPLWESVHAGSFGASNTSYSQSDYADSHAVSA